MQTVYIRTDVVASTVSGTVSAVQGSAEAATPLAGAAVSLGTGTGAGFVVATGTDNTPLTASTDPAGGNVAGYFSFSTVKDGTYVVRVTRAGYTTAEQSVAVTHGQATAALAITLSRVSHAVSVSVTSMNGFSLAGTPVTLTPTGANPSLGAQTLAGGGTNVYTTTFNQVPFGTWTVGFGFGSGANLHFGTPVATGTTSGFAVTVSNSPTGGDSSATYSMTEGQLDLRVSINPKVFGAQAAPATVTMTVRRQATGAAVYTNPSFPTTGGPTSLWLPATTYTVTVTPPAASAPGWVAPAAVPVEVPSSATAVATAVTLSEQPSGLKILVRQGGAARAPPRPP